MGCRPDPNGKHDRREKSRRAPPHCRNLQTAFNDQGIHVSSAEKQSRYQGLRGMTAQLTEAPLRDVVIGRNSKVWRAVSANQAVAQRFKIAISHSEVAGFAFTPADRVWVFSYSRVPAQNSGLLANLQQVREVVYVSTATTNVTKLTHCYQYPCVKQAAESEARQRLNARILTLGLVVKDLREAPGGRTMTTPQSMIEAFILAPQWPHDGGNSMRLFEPIDAPYVRPWEARLHRLYDSVQWKVRRWPCVLRPVDLVLRAMGVRWYGYLNLSNRIWSSTISS